MTDRVPTELQARTDAIWHKRASPIDVAWFDALEAEDLQTPELIGGLIGELILHGGRWYGVARADGDADDEALVAVAADTRREACSLLFETAKAWASHAHRHATKTPLTPSARGLRVGARLQSGGVVTAVRDDGYPELDGVWVYRDET